MVFVMFNGLREAILTSMCGLVQYLRYIETNMDSTKG